MGLASRAHDDYVEIPSQGERVLWKVVHASPGRIRFRSPVLYRNESHARRLGRRLGSVNGLSFRISTITGGLLIHYSSPHTRDTLEALIGAPLTVDETARDSAAATHWHSLGVTEAIARVGSSARSGLSARQIAERMAKDGGNSVAPAVPLSGLAEMGKQLSNVPSVLLLASAGLTFFTGGTAGAAAMAAVVLLNAGLALGTERRTARLIRALRSLPKGAVRVRREGRTLTLHPKNLVVGDVILLSPGLAVPADARLVEAAQLMVDESTLTGESAPREKRAEAVLSSKTPLAERDNLVFRGTLVTAGNGEAVVVATGGRSELGQVQAMLDAEEKPQTPLQSELDGLGRQLVAVTGAVCGGVFLLGLLRGYGLFQMIKTSVSLAVAAIPEGLPAVATTAFGLSVVRLRRRNILLRHLHAVEALGAVDVLCLDKTGTLTQNRMAVTRIALGKQLLRFPDDISEVDDPALLRLVMVAALCNDAEIVVTPKGPLVHGSPTEQALLELALDLGVDLEALRDLHPKLRTHLRSEQRRLMSTRHRSPGGSYVLAVKGSPEAVLARCKWEDMGARKVVLTDERRREILEQNRDMASQGWRLLGFAHAVAGQEPEAGHPLTWLGLIAMEDPLRPGMEALVEKFHRAGIATIMLTGDQKETATAVARRLRLTQGEPRVADASEIDGPLADVYARVSPSDKLRIVRSLQARGKIVAMTGDGVNDGPALRAADVGIALGRGGTDMAREVGDLVLADDNLDGLIEALGEGRVTYDNIRKSVRFILETNLAEVLLVGSAVTLGIGLPLNPMQLLWINVVTDVFPALALALDPPSPDVLTRPPRPARASLIDRNDLRVVGASSVAMAAGAMGAYAFGRLRHGAGAHAETMAFTTLTAAQLLHAFPSRAAGSKASAKNPFLKGAVGAGFGLQALSLFFPPLRRLLGNERLGWKDAAACAAGALGGVVLKHKQNGGSHNGILKS